MAATLSLWRMAAWQAVQWLQATKDLVWWRGMSSYLTYYPPWTGARSVIGRAGFIIHPIVPQIIGPEVPIPSDGSSHRLPSRQG